MCSKINNARTRRRFSNVGFELFIRSYALTPYPSMLFSYAYESYDDSEDVVDVM